MMDAVSMMVSSEEIHYDFQEVLKPYMTYKTIVDSSAASNWTLRGELGRLNYPYLDQVVDLPEYYSYFDDDDDV